MEPANIDWNNIESIFVIDELYENINAPKWVDFSALDNDYVDDEAWFCKPECRHPKTAEDFRKSSFVSRVKHFRSQTLSSLSENFPYRDRNLRDENMKNRKWNKSKTFNSSTSDRIQEDQENDDPNNSETTPSKTDKKKPFEERKSPKLKSVPSASNLFTGRDILNQITDFCSELKKMVLKSKEEGENSKKLSDETNTLLEKESSANVLKVIDTENKPLLEVKKAVSETVEMNNEKKPRKLKRVEKENCPITMDVNMIKHAQGEKLLQVRTNPPSPQCFSAYREPLRKAKQTTPLKPSKAIRADKGILQEVEQNNRVDRQELAIADKPTPQNIAVAGKEARTMEMFWILKPCITK